MSPSPRKLLQRRFVYPFVILAAAVLFAYGYAPERQSLRPTSSAEIGAALMESDQAALFATIRRGFGGQYADFLSEMAALTTSGALEGDLAAAVFARSQAFTSQLRRENAHFIRSAPPDKIRAMRQATLDVLVGLQETPEACMRFGLRGASALDPATLSPAQMAQLDRAAVLTFEAILAGRDHPVTNSPPQEGDRAAFLAAWRAATGPGDTAFAALQSGDGAPDVLCSAFISMERYILSDRSPLSERVLAELSARSAGY